jgi:hypothetical protein
MSNRTSTNHVQQLEDLNDLEQIVIDKRNHKRSVSKKNRRNRHYTKLLIKHQLDKSSALDHSY